MATVIHWNTGKYGALTEENLRQYLEKMVYHEQRYVYPTGYFFHDHKHDDDKIDEAKRLER